MTAFLLRASSVAQEAVTHDRRIGERAQDLRRWVRDTDRGWRARLAGVTGDDIARGTGHSSSHQAGIKIATEIFRR
jgi:hypothetical protein